MLKFASDYDLADFIVYILALPVLIGCVVASTCLLRRWTDTSRGLLIVYNVAVVVTFIAFGLEIADYIAEGSIDYDNADWASLPYGPLEILEVFVNSFDLIFRVATLTAVAYFVVNQMMNAGRARLMKFASIAAVLALSALTIIGIAFRGVNEGHQVAYEYAVNTGDSYLEYYQEEREVEHWRLRITQVQMAFYAVYFAAVLAILVASFLARSRVLSSAVLVLLTITVLEVVHTAWALYIRTNPDYGDDYDSDGYDIYVQIAWILEIFLQTGLLMTLLFAPPRPFK